MSNARSAVDLAVRTATLSDSAALASLMGELGYPTTEKEMRERLEKIFSDSQFRAFVGEIAGEVCGMIGTIAQLSFEHNDLSGRILALVVSKEYRRRGVARELIKAAEEDFRKRNVTRISLTTRITREGAHRFYEELGYENNGYRYVKNLS